MKNNIQICATVAKTTAEDVDAIAKASNRTFSQMVDILLQLAVKERTRKKKTAHKAENE